MSQACTLQIDISKSNKINKLAELSLNLINEHHSSEHIEP
jgi:hypothetical protein